MTTRMASCLCRGILVKVIGDPFTYTICHCLNCKKSSGSAFLANTFFKTENVTVTQGAELLKEYKDSGTASGRILTRSFCSNCGSTMFLRPSTDADVPRSDIIILPVSMVNDPHDWQPRKELHLENKCSWLKEISLQTKSTGMKPSL